MTIWMEVYWIQCVETRIVCRTSFWDDTSVVRI